MALFSEEFMAKSREKWTQKKIDGLSMTVFHNGKKILTATPKLEKGTVKAIIKLKGDDYGK